ncbi:MAG TPA: diacylglycerol kinase family protein, partial [Flavobacteriaceae bacterium]|nr:diacylglycerol kinase family protein [Flavobacteriaceae bacterium]
MKKVLFIINPLSGTDRIKALQKDIEKNLDLNVFDYEIIYTQFPNHGEILAVEGVKKNFDIIVAVGGDGSVNDVIKGLYGSPAILGIIPMGSGNGLARSLKIPLNEVKAIQLLNTFHIQEIDVGKADGHLFASNAGVGFDQVVTDEFSNNQRRGFLAYIGIILKNIWFYKPKKWTIEIDGKTTKTNSFMLTVANAVQLGYGFQIAPKSKIDDGYFDLVNVKKFPVLLASLIALRAFSGTIHKSRFVTTQKIKKVRISHPELNQFQLDGENLPCGNEII